MTQIGKTTTNESYPTPNESYQIRRTTPAARPDTLRTVLTGTAVGAVTGALAMSIYAVVHPFFFINVAELSSAYIASDARSSLLIAGALVGGTAGAIRTLVDTKFPLVSSYEKTVNTGCGMLAGPAVVVTKCILFPALEELWKLPFATFFHAAACSIAGGFSATFLAPVGITASVVARWATRSI